MKNWQIVWILTFLITGIALMSGCTNQSIDKSQVPTTNAKSIMNITSTPLQTTLPTSIITPVPTSAADKRCQLLFGSVWYFNTSENRCDAPKNIVEEYCRNKSGNIFNPNTGFCDPIYTPTTIPEPGQQSAIVSNDNSIYGDYCGLMGNPYGNEKDACFHLYNSGLFEIWVRHNRGTVLSSTSTFSVNGRKIYIQMPNGWTSGNLNPYQTLECEYTGSGLSCFNGAFGYSRALPYEL